MNSVDLIGRLTRDPEIRYTSDTQNAQVTFTIAVDRLGKPGEEKKTDFPRIVVYGRQAEACEKYLKKGRQVVVQGRLQTGSYKNKHGETVYTTDVVANRVEFLDWGNQSQEHHSYSKAANKIDDDNAQVKNDQVDAFEEIDDDVPF